MRLAYNGRGIYSFISNIIEVSANIRIFFHYDGRNPPKSVSFVNEYPRFLGGIPAPVLSRSRKRGRMYG